MGNGAIRPVPAVTSDTPSAVGDALPDEPSTPLTSASPLVQPSVSRSSRSPARAGPVLPAIHTPRSLTVQTLGLSSSAAAAAPLPLPGTLATPLSPSPLSPSPSSRWLIDSNEHRSLICRFCGGGACKREDYTRQSDRANAAIIGLHSHYVTASIIAMQRPSTRLIQHHMIVDQFVHHNVRAIINCQIAGEHALCGDGIHSHGYSYHSEDFPHCHSYHFGWIDFGVPSLSKMLSIAQVMASHIQRGEKVAVHCHAGYGRTGLVIACYLIYEVSMTSHEAVMLVRAKRPGSIQTKEQVKFVYRFEQFLGALRCQYVEVGNNRHYQSITGDGGSSNILGSPSLSAAPMRPLSPSSPSPSALPSPAALSPRSLSNASSYPDCLAFPLPSLSLLTILRNQQYYLHGAERLEYHHYSKAVALVIKRLVGHEESLCLEILKRTKISVDDRTLDNTGSNAKRPSLSMTDLPFDFLSSWDSSDSEKLLAMKQAINSDKYSAVTECQSLLYLLILVYDWCSELSEPLLTISDSHDSIRQCIEEIDRMSLLTVNSVVAIGKSLIAAANNLAVSNAVSLTTFLRLLFGYALTQPITPPPPALRLHPRSLMRTTQCIDGSKQRTEASHSEIADFTLAMFEQWDSHYVTVRASHEERRIAGGVGVRPGVAKWWLADGSLYMSPLLSHESRPAGPSSGDTTTASANTTNVIESISPLRSKVLEEEKSSEVGPMTPSALQPLATPKHSDSNNTLSDTHTGHFGASPRAAQRSRAPLPPLKLAKGGASPRAQPS